MEAVQVGAVADDHAEKWSSFTVEEEEVDYDFMSQFLFNGDNNYPPHQYPCNYSSLDLLSTFWAGVDQSPDPITNYYYSSSPEGAATTGGGCGGLFPVFPMPAVDQQPIHCPAADLLINYDENIMTEAHGDDEHEGKNGLQVEGKGEDEHQVCISKKRSLIQVDVQNKKKERNTQPKPKPKPMPKKNNKLGSNIDDHGSETNPQPVLLPQGQTSSTSLSEDDSINTSISTLNNPDATVALLNSNGKTKSRQKCPTTDPPSLYARRRRERINERLRNLQNLVPNGTKVDISTMLEEAVHYVKFLQLQIKLLSSDELWMYAPIAYNGRNIGLDLTF